MSKYNIKGTTTEEYHPQQNPSEHSVQGIKKGSEILLGRTGATKSAEFKANQHYIAICVTGEHIQERTGKRH